MVVTKTFETIKLTLADGRILHLEEGPNSELSITDLNHQIVLEHNSNNIIIEPKESNNKV